ncbi:MAG: GNAT family N-acetyltransferase [Chitinivibrionales bacterium]|nr:GNAT family N-acetyltransferase [Chitinivibrionales bacterium]
MDTTQYTTSTDTKPSSAELSRLFSQTGWAAGRQGGDIEIMLANTQVFVAVRKAGTLVGFGRALSDGVYRALVDDIVVDESCRGQGLGAHIMESLMRQLSGIEEVFLNTGPNLEHFYARFGFAGFGGLTMKAEFGSTHHSHLQSKRSRAHR